MPALPLRLAILTLVAAVPLLLLAACAGDDTDAAAGASALSQDDSTRVDALILEAFSTSTPTNFTTDFTSERSCLGGSAVTTKVLQWNVLGGQWFAPTLRAGLAMRGVTEQLTVVETPSAISGLLDITFLGTSTELDGAASSLCGADGGAGSAVVLLDCKNIASAGMMTSIDPSQCTSGRAAIIPTDAGR